MTLYHRYAKTGDIITEKRLKNTERNVKNKVYMTMNKLKNKIIRMLGGVTTIEHEEWAYSQYICGRKHAYESILRRMKFMYGLPAEQWCEEIYKTVEEAHKNFNSLYEKEKKCLEEL